MSAAAHELLVATLDSADADADTGEPGLGALQRRLVDAMRDELGPGGGGG